MVSKKTKSLTEEEKNKLHLLRQLIKSFKRVCVAYSGGVDSSLVAAIAQEQLKTHAIAITGVSPALSPSLLNEARKQAIWIGIIHKECKTKELENPSYSKNPQDRCYTCKKELHKHLIQITKAAQGTQVIDGVNHDDLNEFRPGINAAREAGVRSPLAELQISKISVRNISDALGLPWWNKPAQPCLASRFPYGEHINETRLRQVDKGEEWLKGHGFNEVRVRSQGLSAKIEVPKQQIRRLINELNNEAIVDYFLSIGFTSVSLDLEGLVSGKLNRKANQSGKK